MSCGCTTISPSGSWLANNPSGQNGWFARSAAAGVWTSRDQRLGASRDLARNGAEHRRRGNWVEAKKSFQAAIELWPAETQNYLDLAELYQAEGDSQTALQHLQTGLKYDANNAQVHLLMAELFYLQKDETRAKFHAERILELGADADSHQLAKAWHIKAKLLYDQQHLNQSLAACFQSLAIAPNREEVLELICHVYFRQQRPMRSWSIVQQMNSRYTDENRPAKLRLLEAETLSQMDRPSEAVQSLQRWYREGGDQNPECCEMLAAMTQVQMQVPAGSESTPQLKADDHKHEQVQVALMWQNEIGDALALPEASRRIANQANGADIGQSSLTHFLDERAPDNHHPHSPQLVMPIIERPKFRPLQQTFHY